MPARLVRSCIALAFTACVLAVACTHRLVADSVKGGELSYMPLALQREPTVYSSLLMVAGAVLTDPEPMPARLVRGCIALAFTACVLAVACSAVTALLIPSRVASSATCRWRYCNWSQQRTARY